MMKELTQLALKAKRAKYPSLPEYALTVPRYTDKTANGMTKAIIDYLKFEGWQAERISVTGRYIDQSRTYVDILGHHKKIGSGKWIPTSGQKGTADISATIKGRSVKIEIKIGKDKQSNDQLTYQKQVEDAGGVYFIARDWKGFIDWYKTIADG